MLIVLLAGRLIQRALALRSSMLEFWSLRISGELFEHAPLADVLHPSFCLHPICCSASSSGAKFRFACFCHGTASRLYRQNVAHRARLGKEISGWHSGGEYPRECATAQRPPASCGLSL